MQGNVAVKLPLPPGCLTTLWHDAERFKSTYLDQNPGYYTSGDGGYFDSDDYLFVMGRVDDVINIAGHRLSTGDIEEALGKHNSIAEAAVVAISDDLKDEIPVGFVVTNSPAEHANKNDSQVLSDKLKTLVRDKIGPIACYEKTIIAPRLPKTRSGEILRKTIKHILNQQEYVLPATIEDPAVLDEITQIINNQ